MAGAARRARDARTRRRASLACVCVIYLPPVSCLCLLLAGAAGPALATLGGKPMERRTLESSARFARARVAWIEPTAALSRSAVRAAVHIHSGRRLAGSTARLAKAASTRDAVSVARGARTPRRNGYGPRTTQRILTSISQRCCTEVDQHASRARVGPHRHPVCRLRRQMREGARGLAADASMWISDAPRHPCV